MEWYGTVLIEIVRTIPIDRQHFGDKNYGGTKLTNAPYDRPPLTTTKIIDVHVCFVYFRFTGAPMLLLALRRLSFVI